MVVEVEVENISALPVPVLGQQVVLGVAVVEVEVLLSLRVKTEQ
jgi:hypothetical protein